MPDGAWIRGRNIQLLPPGLALNQSDGLSRSTLQMPGPTCSESASVCRCPGFDWHANHHSDFRFANTAFMTWHTVLRHQPIAVPPELPPMLLLPSLREDRYSKIPTPDLLSGAGPGTRHPHQPNKVDLHRTSGFHVAISAGSAPMSGSSNITTIFSTRTRQAGEVWGNITTITLSSHPMTLHPLPSH